MGQLHGNLEGFDLELPPEAAARLDEVSWTPEVLPVTGVRIGSEAAAGRG